MKTAWLNAAGKYNLNMSEATQYGSGATARKKHWAIAMGGAYVMVLGMDIKNTPIQDLKDLGYLSQFMTSTNFHDMAPHDELAYSDTEYVLAFPGDSYIAYSSAYTTSMGLKDMTGGQYRLTWFDTQTGESVLIENVDVLSGNNHWTKPNSLGNKLALFVKRTSASDNVAPVANSMNVSGFQNNPLAINLSYTDIDGPGPFSVAITRFPSNGSITGNGTAWTYQANSGFTGTDSLTFTVNDSLADSNEASVLIAVNAIGNIVPVAQDQTYSINQESSLQMSLVYNDNDGPGPYEVTIVTFPGNGVLTGTGNDRTYTPNAGFYGTDSFSWKVSDGMDESNTSLITITIHQSKPSTPKELRIIINYNP